MKKFFASCQTALEKFFANTLRAVIVGLLVGSGVWFFDAWNFVEPVTGFLTMALAAAAFLQAARVYKIQGEQFHTLADMDRKDFEITFGLRKGYQGEGAQFTVVDATAFIREWMQQRVNAKLPILTGKVAPVDLVYPVRNTENGFRVTTEASCQYTGMLSPVYDKDRREEEVVRTLSNLAEFIGARLGQKRVYLSFRGKSWVIDSKQKGPLLGHLATGEEVYDAIPSHVDDHPGAPELLPEALAMLTSAGAETIAREVELGRVVGESHCVPTAQGDEIVWARRPDRTGLSRFVKGKMLVACSTLAVVLRRQADGTYTLVTAYVGPLAPPEPWDQNASETSLKFWQAHALTWGHLEVVPGTETTTPQW